MKDTYKPFVKGKVNVYKVFQKDAWDGEGILYDIKDNMQVYGGMDLLCRLAAGQNTPINGMYFEFVNTADPSSIVTPTINPEDGVEYYTNLADPADYLRVPAGISAAPFPSSEFYKTNAATWMGATAQAQGQHGVEFSSAAGSVTYGGALVHLGPTPEQDIVFCRVYMAAERRPAKSDVAQVGFKWTLTFKHPADTE